ncbi:hypothetical protein B0H17DRAFT_1215391 [Mycena rosella]|uniref:Uncharacterized protein n=1 Tax=Mycena rosella TaxID=1033263 RepID=A0AAD7CHF0_MYCRO|nr:hypothetical protein B0H17DRAFT_1215391 [Mycena rosella]
MSISLSCAPCAPTSLSAMFSISRALRAPMDQFLALLELGATAYRREGPGELYVKYRWDPRLPRFPPIPTPPICKSKSATQRT